jgi:cytochrome P450
MITLLFFTPIGLLILWRLAALLVNYIAALKLGIPIIILPFSQEDGLFMLLRPYLTFLQHLPLGLGSWFTYADMGWPMADGYDTVSRLNSETFVLVSPTRLSIWTAYPDAAERVYKASWDMPPPFNQPFTFYGQNVSSTNGEEWRRHRKITALMSNEATMGFVWDESIERVTKDLSFLSEEGRTVTLKVIREGFNLLAMHVLATVGFGQADTALNTLEPGHTRTLMDSLGFIANHVFLTILFAGLKAPDVLLPAKVKELKVCVREFRMYMEETVLKQLRVGKSSKPSLLSALVGANEAAKSEKAVTAHGRPSYLSDSELYGNIYVFNIAGYETTAGTMSFALPYLALHQSSQDWVVEEIDRYFTTAETKDYREIYPKLVRCMAFMYETLRLAGPAPQMVRTPSNPTELTIADPVEKSSGPISITLEPGMLITGHFYGLHLSPRWGTDVHLFNPKRFIAVNPNTGEEELKIPEGVGFMPWALGPRVCPGKKFSLVEFVAVIAAVLSEYRVEADVTDGEEKEQAKRRLEGVLGEKYFNISSHVRRPEEAGVKFVRRR